jgi:hypothetical protein
MGLIFADKMEEPDFTLGQFFGFIQKGLLQLFRRMLDGKIRGFQCIRDLSVPPRDWGLKLTKTSASSI